MQWTIATVSLLPGTTNVHSIQMAYEWRRQQQIKQSARGKGPR